MERRGVCGGEGIWKHVWLAGLCKSKANGQYLGWQLLSGHYTRRRGACQYLCQASLSEGKGETRIMFPLLVGPGGSIGSPRMQGWVLAIHGHCAQGLDRACSKVLGTTTRVKWIQDR